LLPVLALPLLLWRTVVRLPMSCLRISESILAITVLWLMPSVRAMVLVLSQHSFFFFSQVHRILFCE